MGRVSTIEEFLTTGQTWIVDDQPAVLNGIDIEPTTELSEALEVLLAPERKQGSGDRLADNGRDLQRLAVEVISHGLERAGERGEKDRAIRVPSQLFTVDFALLSGASIPELQFDVSDTENPERNARYTLGSTYLWIGHAAMMYSQPQFVADRLTTVAEAIHRAVV